MHRLVEIQRVGAFLVVFWLLTGSAQSQAQTELPPKELKARVEAMSTASGKSKRRGSR
jgi:hypothetical protein